MRLMKPNPVAALRLPDVRTDKRNLQRGSTNDPYGQDGRLYLDEAHTAYIYVDPVDRGLYYVAPSASAVKIS